MNLFLAKLKKRLWLLKHKGNKYVCPFCGYASDMMLPFGKDTEASIKHMIVGAGKRDVCCLKCGSHDRERLIYIFLKQVIRILDPGENPSLLHIAPEPRLSQALRSSHLTTYICGDLFAEGYTYPDYVKNMDVLQLPFKDGSFDIVICNHVLEHIPEDKKAMREICRVLAPEGFALLQVPISYELEYTMEDFSIEDPQQRETMFGQEDHCRLYGMDYIDRLRDCGLDIEILNISKDYSQYCINPNENLFVCRKMSKNAQTL